MTLDEIIDHLSSIDSEIWYQPYGKDEPIPLGKIAANAVFKLKQMRTGLQQINDITTDYVKEKE